MKNLTKGLVAGMATVAVSATALVGAGMYAANTGTTSVSKTTDTSTSQRKGGFENMITSLQGKVSPEALTALQNLMSKHKAEMDAARTNGQKPDETLMKTQHEAFKKEMDALVTKYPELKTALESIKPAFGKGGPRGERNHEEVEKIMATLPETAQTELKSIRDSYREKQEALRTEEKAKIDTILSKYPEVKAKLDALTPEKGNR
jgi:hypothetical protein